MLSFDGTFVYDTELSSETDRYDGEVGWSFYVVGDHLVVNCKSYQAKAVPSRLNSKHQSVKHTIGLVAGIGISGMVSSNLAARLVGRSN